MANDRGYFRPRSLGPDDTDTLRRTNWSLDEQIPELPDSARRDRKALLGLALVIWVDLWFGVIPASGEVTVEQGLDLSRVLALGSRTWIYLGLLTYLFIGFGIRGWAYFYQGDRRWLAARMQNLDGALTQRVDRDTPDVRLVKENLESQKGRVNARLWWVYQAQLVWDIWLPVIVYIATAALLVEASLRL